MGLDMTTKASSIVEGVPCGEVDFPKIEDFLENFARRSLGRWTVESLMQSILGREKQVWKINDYQALCLTSVGHESVNIEACAGIRRHEWQGALDDELRRWARALGKKRIIALVRPGWAKFGKAQGYKEAHREMVLDL